MPGAQHNLRKTGTRKHLDNLQYTVLDTSDTSPQYFRITQLPEVLTAGKNLFRIKAHPDNLVPEANIYVELIDYSGNVLYTQPLNYLSADQTRVVSIWIYPDASPGPATLRVASRAQRDAFQNRNLRYITNDVNSPLYYNFPNVLWSKVINIAPDKRNNTEIIYTRQPQVRVREIVKPYLQPIDIAASFRNWSGSGTVTVEPAPSNTNTFTAANSSLVAGSYTFATKTTQEGQFSPNTPKFGKNSIGIPYLQMSKQDMVPAEVSSAPYQFYSPADQSTITFEGWYELSSSMLGATVSVVNPQIQHVAGTAINSTTGRIVAPGAPNTNAIFFTAAAGQGAADTTYVGTISSLIDNKSAKITPFEWLYGYNAGAQANQSFTDAKSSFGMSSGIADTIEASSNFTMSFFHPGEIIQTENSMSYAEIILSNIEPATGDVYKVGTFFKPGGAIGQFQHLGDTVLERQNLLIDTGSEEMQGQTAIDDLSIGVITNQSHIDTYFESASIGTTPNFARLRFQVAPLFSSLSIETGSNSTSTFGVGDALIAAVKDEYSVTVTEGTEYVLSFSAVGTSTDKIDPGPSVPVDTRIDIYISGSSSGSSQVVTPDETTLTYPESGDLTLISPYDDQGKYGTRIGSLEGPSGVWREEEQFRFVANYTDEIKPFFIVRKGKWNLRDIKLVVNRETGFSPNYLRTLIRIPSEHMNTPLTFRFNYYDYQGAVADTVTYVYGAVFDGDNTYIEGTDNLMSGSLYIGNTIGSGIEMAGAASGFVRSVGFKGFTSASLGTTGPGFMFYSGSVIPNETDDYATGGVGLDLVSGSKDFLSFHTTGPRKGLKIQTPSFFLGGDSAFISGANGQIEITSSNFHLDRTGSVVMQGTITAEAGGTIGGFTIGTDTLTATNFQINTTNRTIKMGSVDNIFQATADDGIWLGAQDQEDAPFSVSPKGALTSSAGTIGGLEIANAGLSVPGRFGISASSNAFDPAAFISSSEFKVSVTGRMTASAGLIGGFELSDTEIKSSNNNLILKSTGEITGSSVNFFGGKIAGFVFDDTSLFSKSDTVDMTDVTNGTGIRLDATTTPAMFVQKTNSQNRVSMFFNNASDFGLKGTVANNNIFQLGSTNQIAGWSVSASKLTNLGVHLSASYGLKVFDGTDDNNDFVELKYKASDDFGIKGVTGGSTIFELGSTNQIAGWAFDDEKLTGGNMIIRKSGTIESNGFASNVAGSGFRLTAEQGGFLEVENARIRGTLATVEFEKETVNAVGGQLYVANSTVLTSSLVAPEGIHSQSMTTMSVKNVTGFAAGEILSAKQISQTGFATEYIFVDSASRTDASSETDMTGFLFVQRGYSGSAPVTDTGSLGDLASSPLNYSGSQVIVSTGKVGTGYIRLNANPNDPTTPYIDIVERTGSSIYDIDLKARLGDLSGITDQSFSDGVTGFGLYTGNGYFKGKVEVTNADGASMEHNFGGPSGSIVPQTKLVPDGTSTGSQWLIGSGSHSNTKHRVENGVLFMSASSPGTWKSELRSKQRFNRTDDHTFVADITLADDQDTFMMIGWGNAGEPAGNVTTVNALWKNNAHVVYFRDDEIEIYEGGSQIINEALIPLPVSTAAKYRVWIKPNSDTDGAHYRVYLHPNLSGSILDTNTAGMTNAKDFPVLDAAIFARQTTETFHIDNIQVLEPGALSTVIEGGRITTGKIRSTNFGASAGSEFDLDNGTFKLGGTSSPKLSFDAAGNLAVQGTITVTNPGDFVQPSETGSMLASATASLATGAQVSASLASATSSLVTNASTASLLTAAQTSSLENPDAYSFGGAGFSLEQHTAAAGLNLTSHFLGYHNGSSFQTFMSSSGDFFLGGQTGVFQWDHSAGSLHVSGSLVELNTPKFFFGTATPGEVQFISGSNGIIEISSSGFHLTPEGSITATAGTIGGFQINSDNLTTGGANNTGDITLGNNQLRLSAVNSVYRLWAGAASPASAPFAVTKDGAVTASAMRIEGDSTFGGSLDIGPGLNDSLIARFTFENTAGTQDDLFANSIQYGTTHPSASEWTVDYAFDGGAAVATAGGGGVVLLEDADVNSINYLTFSFWFKPLGFGDDNDGAGARIITRDLSDYWGVSLGADHSGHVGWDTDGYAPARLYFDADPTDYITIPKCWKSGSWHFVAGTFDYVSDVAKYYIYQPDGTKIITGSAMDTGMTPSINNARAVVLGSNSEDASEANLIDQVSGSFAEIRFYSGSGRVLTSGEIDSLYRDPRQGGEGTRISAAGLKTAKIESNNFGTLEGSQINLNEGTLAFGGSANPNFHVSESGFVTAVNFSERVVEVTQANSASYFNDESTTGVGLVFNGAGTNHPNSTPGLATMNLKLSVRPYNHSHGGFRKITNLYLPNTGSSLNANANIIVNVDGVTFESDEVSSNHNENVQKTLSP